MIADVLDLFAGPGGWSVALDRLGLTEVGVEWDAATYRTARAAGHCRTLADVRGFTSERGTFRGLIASPPCQTFSQAGDGTGRRDLARLLSAVGLVADGERPADALHQIGTGWLDDDLFGPVDPLDERSSLVLEPMRIVREVEPEWIALEQVPGVLPVWQAYARHLRALGYRTWVGILHAEQYGVPQTRRRAILTAHRHRDVEPPRPTHSRYHTRHPERLDPGVRPWVSMADALGWGMTARPYVTVAAGTTSGGTDPQVLGGSGARRAVQDEINAGRWFTPAGLPIVDGLNPRPLDRPAHTITGAGSAMWLDRFNDQSGTDFDPLWPAVRPATTVAGRRIIANPGQNTNRMNDSTSSRNDGVRVTVSEAGVLQGFRADYPWSGNGSEQYQQVGDAVPPPLGEAILRTVVDDLICTECGNDTTAIGEPFCLDCLEGGASQW